MTIATVGSTAGRLLRPVLDEDRTERNRLVTDAAIELNRRNTPQEVIDKRAQKRLSIAELNQLDIDDIRERIERLPRPDNRPGVIRLLDLLDLPRNAVANAVAYTVLPGVKRAAVERNERGTLGVTRVTGSDLLRGLGVDNRVVAGLGGFALDIVTDPISWIGTPIGGLTVKGARAGTKVALGTTGQRVVRRGIKEAAEGGIQSVKNPTVRRLLESTGEVHGIDDAAGLSEKLIGTTDRFSGRILGVRGEGGELAEAAFRSMADASTPIGRQTLAAKELVERYTLNRGLKLGTAGRPTGTAVAHVPFTDITVYTPAWTKAGKQRVFQRAVALAREGKYPESAIYESLYRRASEIDALAREANDLFRDVAVGAEHGHVPMTASGIPVRDRIREIAAKAKEARDAFAAERSTLQAGSHFQNPENIGDLLAAAEKVSEIDAQYQHIANQARWSDPNPLTGISEAVPTHADIELEKGLRTLDAEHRAHAYNIAALDVEGALDDLAPDDYSRAAMNRVLETMHESSIHRLASLSKLADDDLPAAEAVADAFQASVTTAAELALETRGPLLSALTGDQRQMAYAARRLMGLGPDLAGAMPLARFTAAANRIVAHNKASSVSGLLAEGFGINRGDVAELMSRLRTEYVHAPEMSKRVAVEFMKGSPEGGRFSRGLEDIATAHGVPERKMPELLSLVSAMASAKARNLSGWGEGTPTFWALRPDGTPTAASRLIESARASGLLENKELLADLDRLSDEFGGLFSEQAWRALKDGDLNALSLTTEAPLPTRMTPIASERFGRVRDAVLKGGGEGKEALGEVLQNFQRGRGTTEIRFIDRAGKERNLLEVHFDLYQHLTPADLAAVTRDNPIAGRALEEIKDDIDEFSAIYPSAANDPILRTQAFGRAPDPFELNEMMNEGVFRAWMGGLVDKGIWETDPRELIAMRLGADRQAQTVNALREATQPFALQGDPEQLAHMVNTPGLPKTLASGARIVSDANGRLLVGDEPYRRIGSAAASRLALSPFKDISESLSAWYPEALAQQIERFAQLTDPDKIGDVFKLVNNFNSLWKVSTLVHPSWIVVNTVGNAMLLGMAHLTGPKKAASLGGFLADSAKIAAAANNPKRLAELSVEVAGRRISGPNFLELSNAYRIANSGINADALDNVMQSVSRKRVLPRPGDIPSRFKASFEEATADSAAAWSRIKMPAAERGLHRFRAGARAFNENVTQPAVRAWFTANGKVDDVFRMASFLQYMDDGFDAASAAEKTRRAMLNFGDLTNFEAKWMRNLMPFYSWLRASMPEMTRKLVSEPRYFATVPKVLTAMEELFAGEDRLPRHMRPRWIQEQLGVQFGTNPETRKALTVGTVLPQEQTLRVATGLLGLAPGVSGFSSQDFMDTMDFWLGQFNPIVRGFVDLGTGRESFTGRTIGADLTEGDITVNEYLLGQVRWLKELGVGSVRTGPLQKSFEEGIVPGLSRLAVGGRLQPGLAEERRLYALRRDMRDKERRIRKAVALAEREGNAEASKRARVALLKLYRDHLHAAGDPQDVPKWAKGMLEPTAPPGTPPTQP